MSSCDNCGHAEAIGACSGCEQVAYCGEACRDQHWYGETGGHALDCIGLGAVYRRAPPRRRRKMAETHNDVHTKKEESSSSNGMVIKIVDKRRTHGSPVSHSSSGGGSFFPRGIPIVTHSSPPHTPSVLSLPATHARPYKDPIFKNVGPTKNKKKVPRLGMKSRGPSEDKVYRSRPEKTKDGPTVTRISHDKKSVK
jgi:hypothetical protein